MKKFLRKLALAATLLLGATASHAQDDSPTVTQKWAFENMSPDKYSKDNMRFGTGFNGKIYYTVNSYYAGKPGKIMTIDETGTHKEFASNDNICSGITSDDAGNIVINYGFPNAPSSTNLMIFPATGGDPITLTLDLPVATGRMDQMGRIVGDIMSDEGGILYLVPTSSSVATILIRNGKQDTQTIKNASFDVSSVVTVNNSTVANPLYSFQEIMDNKDIANTLFAIKNRSQSFAAIIKDNAITKLPATGYTYNGTEGLDVFTLGNKNYQVLPANLSGKQHCPEYEIYDFDGNKLTEIKLSGGNGNQGFGSIIARTISKYKVELYLYYAAPTGMSAAMYEITIPGPPTLYLAGKFQDWDYENAIKLEADDDGNYHYQLVAKDNDDQGFKISTVKGNWEDFNSGAIGASEDNVAYNLSVGEAVKLEEGKLGKLVAPAKGIWNIDIDSDFNLTVTPVIPEKFYIRGDMNEWGISEDYVLAPKFDINNPQPNSNGEYEYESKQIEKVYGEFKISDEKSDVSGFDFGAHSEDNVMVAGAYKESWFTSTENYNTAHQTYEYITFNFYYNPDVNTASYLRMSNEGVEPQEIPHNHHAYDLKMDDPTQGDASDYNKEFVFRFKVTGDVANAYIHFDHDSGNKDGIRPLAGPGTGMPGTTDGRQSWEVGPVTKDQGEVEVRIPAVWFARATHQWTVEIVNFPVQNNIVSKTTSVGGARAALACFTDPEYPEVYGYRVIGLATNKGIDIYDRFGEKIQSALHANCAAFGGTGATNPVNGTTRGTEVYFASWNDKAYGVTAYNITTPNVAPYSVFDGEKDGTGLITAANGNKVGSGTPCVAVWGEGEQTSIIVFDEDIFGNKLAKNVIGENNKTTNPLQLINESYDFSKDLGHTTVEVASTKDGIFVTQIRGDAMTDEWGYYGLYYISMPEGEKVWSLNDVASTQPNLIPSTAGGLDINRSGDLLAVSTYDDIRIFKLSWNGNKPVLEPYMIAENPYGKATNRTIVKFDAANNIHAINVTNGYFKVTAADPKGASVLTSAPSMYTFPVNGTTTGVEDVVAGAEADAEAVYFNLNGVRVESDRLTPGVYVKVVGKNATKVVVR